MESYINSREIKKINGKIFSIHKIENGIEIGITDSCNYRFNVSVIGAWSNHLYPIMHLNQNICVHGYKSDEANSNKFYAISIYMCEKEI